MEYIIPYNIDNVNLNKLVVVNLSELIQALKNITFSYNIKLFKSKKDGLIHGAKIFLTEDILNFFEPVIIYRRLSEISCVSKIETNYKERSIILKFSPSISEKPIIKKKE